jgi:hypothetical protein
LLLFFISYAHQQPIPQCTVTGLHVTIITTNPVKHADC